MSSQGQPGLSEVPGCKQDCYDDIEIFGESLPLFTPPAGKDIIDPDGSQGDRRPYVKEYWYYYPKDDEKRIPNSFYQFPVYRIID